MDATRWLALLCIALIVGIAMVVRRAARLEEENGRLREKLARLALDHETKVIPMRRPSVDRATGWGSV